MCKVRAAVAAFVCVGFDKFSTERTGLTSSRRDAGLHKKTPFITENPPFLKHKINISAEH